MNVWFCSDLHFGHKNIHKFRQNIQSEEENRYSIIRDWHRLVTKRDSVYVLGDAAFTMETIDSFKSLPGKKILIRGNHDLLNTSVYLKYFADVYGIVKYKEFWLSHAPIHPDELRGNVNLHGHVHYESIRKPFDPVRDVKQELDPRYVNCCVENALALTGQCLMSLDFIRAYVRRRSP